MKRSSIAVFGAAIVAASVLPLSGVASAATNEANLTISPAGTKKASATWDSGVTLTGAFDAYLVTADDDPNAAPLAADRSRFVDSAATRQVTFDDLTSGTTYYFAVYAIDYTASGIDIIEPASDTTPDTPIGSSEAAGYVLTINGPTATVLSGNNVNLYGSLVDGAGVPLPAADITVQSNPYPFDDFDWNNNPSPVTDASGKWSFQDAPTINTQYRAFYEPTGTPSAGQIGGWTRNLTVNVKKKLVTTLSPGTKIVSGKKLTYTGKLPAVPGDATYYTDNVVNVCIQRLVAGAWESPVCKPAGADGGYLLELRPGVNADGKYRVGSGMGPAWADSVSRARTITIT